MLYLLVTDIKMVSSSDVV